MMTPKTFGTHRFILRAFSTIKRKDEYEVPRQKPLIDKWEENKGLWRNTLEYFEPKRRRGPDTIKFLQTPIDLSPATVKKWYMNRMEKKEIFDQQFIQERYDICGPDLAAAHFIIYRKGRVRFRHEKTWIQLDEKQKVPLPEKFVPGLYVEAIDAENTGLRYEGLQHFRDLKELRWLNLSKNEHINDWCLDRLSAFYQEGLQYLDISHCPNISHRGLFCLYRMKELDTLVLEDRNDPEMKLACMMLEDIKPKLTIRGITHKIDNLERPID